MEEINTHFRKTKSAGSRRPSAILWFSSGKAAKDAVLLFMLSKCSWIPLLIQQCIVREPFIPKSQSLQRNCLLWFFHIFSSLSIFSLCLQLPGKTNKGVWKRATSFAFSKTNINQESGIPQHVASICWRERSEKKEPTTNAYWKDCEGGQCLLEKVVLNYILRPERNMDWHSWEENFYLKMIVRVVPMTTESWFQKKMWFSWLEWRH